LKAHQGHLCCVYEHGSDASRLVGADSGSAPSQKVSCIAMLLFIAHGNRTADLYLLSMVGGADKGVAAQQVGNSGSSSKQLKQELPTARVIRYIGANSNHLRSRSTSSTLP
jgi:hypothetical protein